MLLSPLSGTLIDRYGVRRVLLPSALVFGLAVTRLAWLTDSLLHFYGVFFEK